MKTKKILRRSRAIHTAGQMEAALPGMQQELLRIFYSTEEDANGKAKVSAKEKLAIANFFARNVALKTRIERELGLTRGSEAKGQDPLIAVFGGNVAVFKGLSAEERQQRVLKFLKGSKEPEALPAPETGTDG